MAGEINFGLLDLNSPAKIVNSFYQGQQDQQQQQGLATQNRLAQLALGQRQQEISDNSALRDVYKSATNPDGTINQGAVLTGAAQKGIGNQIPGLTKSFADMNKATADYHLSQIDLLNKATAAHVSQLKDVNTPQDAALWIKAGHDDPTIGPYLSHAKPLDQAIAGIPQDPQQFQQWKQQQALGATEFVKRNTMTADQIAQTAEAKRHDLAEEGISRANTQKDYVVAGLDPNGKDQNGGVGGLSPAAIENAASRYNVDGTLPPSLGRGQQGARDIRAIQNRAAELAMGTNGTDLRVTQLDNKSAASALTNVSKAKNMAASFESTANANAGIALGLSKQLDRTGVPLINAGLQAWRTGTGSPEATQFAAANETFVNEYAKIMSGGMGNGPVSDSARNKAHGLLSTAMTPDQYEGNVKLLQREMQNRMKGYEDQENAIKDKLRGKLSTPNAASNGPTQISNDADYAKLPSGAEFIAPDGSHRRKP